NTVASGDNLPDSRVTYIPHDWTGGAQYVSFLSLEIGYSHLLPCISISGACSTPKMRLKLETIKNVTKKMKSTKPFNYALVNENAKTKKTNLLTQQIYLNQKKSPPIFTPMND
ncbi:hypothetical protein, partial [Serratia bockelmannii]|uniref:hypothetical protein n=1 Tax=Serratia bockelmannii TaxID=2703793 RepID=UPI002361EE57